MLSGRCAINAEPNLTVAHAITLTTFSSRVLSAAPIPQTGVLWRELVAVYAVCLARVNRVEAQAVFCNVGSRGDDPNMGWIDACANAASMVKYASISSVYPTEYGH